MEQAIGTFLTLVTPNVQVHFHFQNFYIAQIKQWQGIDFSFMPFGFSGVTVTADGENVEAQVVFPNNALSRDWGTVAVRDAWVVRARSLVVDASGNPLYLLSRYVGQVTGASWDETALSLRTSSILDAVGNNVPNRKLNRNLVGALPVTDAIRL
jgi:hypothetical protein